MRSMLCGLRSYENSQNPQLRPKLWVPVTCTACGCAGYGSRLRLSDTMNDEAFTVSVQVDGDQHVIVGRQACIWRRPSG